MRLILSFVFALGLFSVDAVPLANQPLVKIGKETFTVELAKTRDQWMKGLMYREKLGPREGMLFVGMPERIQSFWMKNTLISLDIIYISKDLHIVSIQKRAVPLSEKSLPSAGPAVHVLEIPGGVSDAIKLKAGDKVEFVNVK